MGVVTERILNNHLLALHTAYLAKVISVNDNTAKIQPLGMTKAYGKAAQKQSPLSNVPAIKSALPLTQGDIVLCVCCERNITEAKKGNNTVPPIGHHSMSDSVIVGVL